jgi:maleate isomerase
VTAAEIRIGVLTPHHTPGPEVEFAALAPGKIVTELVHVDGAGGAGEATAATDLAARTAAPFLDRAANTLPADTVEGVGYASTTSGYVIGYDAEMAMLARVSELTGRPASATCPAAVQALRTLGVHRLALIGAPWFDPSFNELGAAYFTAQGFDVVLSRSAVDLPRDPAAIRAAAVCEWIVGRVEDDAEGVFIGGNGFRTAAAIQPLEAVLGRPVLTANQVLLWQLLADTGHRLPIQGFGRLFAQSS